ncbi:colibactin biosynthesis acyltransferase ClbG [Klebsiella aerogenes]|uniref:colibactin biosynthesis acyltransferase ClbG n=1 Tax=Klebsiella aerogenes TaxID=548 RepID=UPI000F7EEB23|nr:colibactin biosynthesis acyltransferase ClbG [Klebsiella aerogenes]RSW73338.1 colibactin biosynthesis acyltransferase ClbG [Klebsiella aerogenes]HCX5171089.1 colibactin biosynthesis acyltransferase ClbG [Escherichia coli]
MTKDVALMFPGSGSQYVGMARWLYERYPQVRTLFDEASQITGRDMAALCLSGTLVQLAEPTAMALAIYTTSVAHFVAWQQFLAQTGVHVNLRYMLGHSLGEYAALTCSGALSFSQALALVAMRSRLASEIAREMDASTTIIKQGNQALVAAACEVAERETRQQVGIACFNSPQQFMLSGQNSAIIAAEQYLLDHDRQVEVVPLIGGVPYHSPLLKPCGQQLRKALDRCEWRRPCCPVISNVNAQPYPDTVTPVQWLEQQLSQPVQWQRSLTYLTGHLSPIAIEIGPQSVLKNLLLENRYPAPVYAFDNRHDRAQLALVLGDNMAVKTDPEAVRRQRITLLTNALTATRHHRAADVAASAQLKELLSRFFERIQQIEQRGTSSEEDIAFLHELLEQGFQLKGSSQAEIDACHARLASDNGGQA